MSYDISVFLKSVSKEQKISYAHFANKKFHMRTSQFFFHLIVKILFDMDNFHRLVTVSVWM